MAYENIKESLGEELCQYCKWKKDGIYSYPGALCEGVYCDEACEAFIDENEEYFDDDNIE